MQTLTGAMEEFYRYFGIRSKLLMCFLIFSAAEANTIVKVAGSEVMLPCLNQSLSSLTQLTWKMNDIVLFSHSPNKPLYTSPKASALNLKMSRSEDELYRLIIERADKSHTGNYSCETSTTAGYSEKTWELIITDSSKAEHQTILLILVAVIVPCVCCLIFILTLTIMRRSCKHQAENSPMAEEKQTEEIYENCLDIYEN